MVENPLVRPEFGSFPPNRFPVTVSALTNNTVNSPFVRSLATFASVLCVFGYPLLGSSCTSSRLSFNRLCHLKTLDFLIAYSPQATANRANVHWHFCQSSHKT
jgi:hypothetical protein